MRRFASVFLSNKREKNEKAPKRTTSFHVRTQAPTSDVITFDSNLSTPQLSAVGSEQVHSSSASSSGSASLQTPEDVPSITKKTWIPWLVKKNGTIKAAHHSESKFTPLPPPLLRNPPPGPRAIPINTQVDPDSDSESYYGETDDLAAKPVTVNPIVTPALLTKSHIVFEAIIQNSLHDRSSSSPFVIQPGAPLYPRSCNRSRSLPRVNTLASTLLKKRLLQKLKTADLQPSEAEFIVAFSDISIMQSTPQAVIIDEKALSKDDHTASSSSGLRSWIARPPFEDRFAVWSAVDGNITCQRISNSAGFALAALEFSEATEASADVYGVPVQPVTLDVPVRSSSTSDIPSSPSSTSSHMSSSASPAKSNASPQLLAPSPLRNQATSSFDSPEKHSPKSPVSPKSILPSSPSSPLASQPPSPAATTVKRGVRFIEEDKDENIPIGYVMRVKKQREEKARFLKEQREKRQFEEERARVEEERRRRDAERRKWEQERLAWEKEKREIEEERKRKLYAEEFDAARQRAESARLGQRSSSSTSLREPERNTSSKRLSRALDVPPSPPRRHTSDSYPRAESPAHSRPSSIHSSSEDIRSHRQSTFFYLPPVPPFPQQFYPQQMEPLLSPPIAPFMVNQYSRRQSQSPKSSSRQRNSSNSSTDSLNRQSMHGNSPRGSSSTSSPSSSPHRTHQRRTSDDNTKRLSAYSTSPRSSSTQLPRGRSTHSIHSQETLPSPWTAPPTLNGGYPTSSSFANGINTLPRSSAAQRQSTFS